MDKIIKNAVEILKNNFNIRRGFSDRGTSFREFTIGIYNRFDELVLIFANLKDISFNDAIEELELNGYMKELKDILSPSKPKTK